MSGRKTVSVEETCDRRKTAARAAAAAVFFVLFEADMTYENPAIGMPGDIIDKVRISITNLGGTAKAIRLIEKGALGIRGQGTADEVTVLIIIIIRPIGAAAQDLKCFAFNKLQRIIAVIKIGNITPHNLADIAVDSIVRYNIGRTAGVINQGGAPHIIIGKPNTPGLVDIATARTKVQPMEYIRTLIGIIILIDRIPRLTGPLPTQAQAIIININLVNTILHHTGEVTKIVIRHIGGNARRMRRKMAGQGPVVL